MILLDSIVLFTGNIWPSALTNGGNKLLNSKIANNILTTKNNFPTSASCVERFILGCMRRARNHRAFCVHACALTFCCPAHISGSASPGVGRPPHDSPEVMKLPNLVHLFGKFKLQKKVILSPGQCNLQTVAGFLVDKSKGFVELMSQMKKLRKVKIWCESSATNANMTNLQEAIQNFIDDVNKSADDPRSLSVHFEAWSEDLLEELHGPCYLASLKLHGRLSKLPRFVNELRGLTELCLQSSTRFTADLLTALCDLKYLRYLKLIAEEFDEVTIKDRKLRTLLHLCFVLKRPKTFPKIEEGSMPYLESLQLLCKDLDGLSGIQIKGFTHLKEVTLDNRVNNSTKSIWVKAANNHPNRPKILLKRVDPQEGDHGEDSAASGATENEIIECPVLPEEPEQDTDAQMPPGELDSVINKITGHHVVCAALTGLSISQNDPVSS